jgi:hypothetical protein
MRYNTSLGQGILLEPLRHAPASLAIGHEELTSPSDLSLLPTVIRPFCLVVAIQQQDDFAPAVQKNTRSKISSGGPPTSPAGKPSIL